MLTRSPRRRPSSAGPPRSARWIAARTVILGLLLAAVTSAVLLADLLPSNRVLLNQGDVSPALILAPADLTYESKTRTITAQEAAAASVQEVFDPPDTSVARQQEVRARQIIDFISSVRQDPHASAQNKQKWISAIPDLTMTPEIIDNILSLSEENWQQVRQEILRVLTGAMQGEIRENQVTDVRRRLPTLMIYTLTDKEAKIVQAIAGGLVKPNTFFNAARTEEARQKARESTAPVTVTIRQGEAIVRVGDRVTLAKIEALDVFGLRQQEIRWPAVAGTVAFAAVVTVLTMLLIARIQPSLWARRRVPIVTMMLLALYVVIAKLMLASSIGPVVAYFYPLPALSMLLAIFFGPALGIAVGIMLGLVAAFITGGSLEMTVYVVAGALVGALALGRGERLKAFLWAGLAVALTNAAVIVIFGLLAPEQDWVELALYMPIGLIMGGLAASLALVAFLALGAVLDIVTPFQLLELSRPTHPLLRQLLLKAPGTYHHAILVSNMAEEAAERIGADALLARVGAYYHDVGKIAQPFYFAENRVGDVNPHDLLDPQISAQVIVSHVNDGLALAEKYRLPSAIRSFIPEHHGTGLALAFYRLAVAAAGDGGQEVREENFRYPGPKPQSRETALVMLADSCEARVRSAQPGSPEEIEQIIRETIDNKITEGQLDECDLTLRDLEAIRAAFFDTLRGIFHPRVKYPEPVKVKGHHGQEIIR
ncbi:MAG: HDIG domain-containing protein [Anaerolineae bacterium]|nr:HDIG domain-containing protein [Anaerolineae bacterium]